jgi:hypothetical protein
VNGNDRRRGGSRPGARLLITGMITWTVTGVTDLHSLGPGRPPGQRMAIRQKLGPFPQGHRRPSRGGQSRCPGWAGHDSGTWPTRPSRPGFNLRGPLAVWRHCQPEWPDKILGASDLALHDAAMAVALASLSLRQPLKATGNLDLRPLTGPDSYSGHHDSCGLAGGGASATGILVAT